MLLSNPVHTQRRSEDWQWHIMSSMRKLPLSLKYYQRSIWGISCAGSQVKEDESDEEGDDDEEDEDEDEEIVPIKPAKKKQKQ